MFKIEEVSKNSYIAYLYGMDTNIARTIEEINRKVKNGSDVTIYVGAFVTDNFKYFNFISDSQVDFSKIKSVEPDMTKVNHVLVSQINSGAI